MQLNMQLKYYNVDYILYINILKYNIKYYTFCLIFRMHLFDFLDMFVFLLKVWTL